MRFEAGDVIKITWDLYPNEEGTIIVIGRYLPNSYKYPYIQEEKLVLLTPGGFCSVSYDDKRLIKTIEGNGATFRIIR